MSRYLGIGLLLLFSLGLLTACGGQGQSTPETLKVRPEAPAEYQDLQNPVDGNSEAQANGEEIYRIHCLMCHGETGEGNGPAAMSLRPAPGDLAANHTDLSDAYLFWRISKGGAMEPFSSAMPAWESILNTEEIWQVIAYIRTLSASDASD